MTEPLNFGMAEVAESILHEIRAKDPVHEADIFDTTGDGKADCVKSNGNADNKYKDDMKVSTKMATKMKAKACGHGYGTAW